MARPRKPTQLKVVEGNRGKRALNSREPDPAYLNDLTPPAWLDPKSSEVWNEIAPKLRAAKVLTEIDAPMLAMACVSLAQYRQAHARAGDRLVIEGELIADAASPDGIKAKGDQLNTWLIVQSMSFKQAMAVLREFGMSPSARSRVAINPQDDLFGNGQAKSSDRYFS